ncbi:MAG: hypothetical protein HC804_00810 [Anaerolineae bacterium]|nr:hypothetical protein [Anaerolineae bacterium]
MIILLLAACGQSVGTAVTSTPVTAVASSEPAASGETDSPATAEPAAEIVQVPVAGSVAEAAQVRASDWTKGTTDPLVSIIEYGDFQ